MTVNKLLSRILQPLAWIVVALISILLFLDVESKTEVSDKFDAIQRELRQDKPDDYLERARVLHGCCMRAESFMRENPIERKIDLRCDEFLALDSAAYNPMLDSLYERIQIVEGEYRGQARKANLWLLAVPTVLSVLIAFVSKKVVKKKE